MKIYLLGGANIKTGVNSIIKKALADAGKKPTVLIFPWTAWFTTPKRNKYRRLMTNYFLKLGARKVIFAELKDRTKILKRKIRCVDFIYLPGGQLYIIKRMASRKLERLLKNFKGVIAGNSAGALALCKRFVVVKGQGGWPKTVLKKGLGLANVTIFVHYGNPNPRLGGINTDNELRRISKQKQIKIFAVPETSALVFDHKLRIINKIAIFENGKKHSKVHYKFILSDI